MLDSGGSTVDGGGGASAAEIATGYVGVYSHVSATDTRGAAQAAFRIWTELPACTTLASNDTCELTFCEHRGTSTRLSAGTIRLTGGQHDVTLEPSRELEYRYETPPGDETVFAGGEALTVSVDGSPDIPAFERTLTAPSKLTLLAPDVSDPSNIVIDPTQDLVVRWEGASAGEVIFDLSVEDYRTERVHQVRCHEDPANGGLTIPASMLALLPPPGADAGGGMVVFSSARDHAVDSAFTFLASVNMVDGSGNRASGFVYFP